MFYDYFCEQGILPPDLHFHISKPSSWLADHSHKKKDEAKVQQIQGQSSKANDDCSDYDDIDVDCEARVQQPTLEQLTANRDWLQLEKQAWMAQHFQLFKKPQLVPTSSIYQMTKRQKNMKMRKTSMPSLYEFSDISLAGPMQVSMAGSTSTIIVLALSQNFDTINRRYTRA